MGTVVTAAVTGAGAPPTVILHGPHGVTVTPVPIGPGAASATAVALQTPKTDTTYVMVRRPGQGTWTITAAADSSAITSVRAARGYAPPRIRADVTGHGTARRLTYSVSARPGLSISFAERSHRTYHVLGRAAGAHGTLHFTPSPGTTGRRTIDAIVSDDGVQREIIAVTSYQAPRPATPGRVHGLQIHRRGRRFQIHFGTATGSSYYLLTVRGTDGRRLLRLIGKTGHSLILPTIGYNDHLRVTVVGVSALGRRGPATRGRA